MRSVTVGEGVLSHLHGTVYPLTNRRSEEAERDGEFAICFVAVLRKTTRLLTNSQSESRALTRRLLLLHGEAAFPLSQRVCRHASEAYFPARKCAGRAQDPIATRLFSSQRQQRMNVGMLLHGEFARRGDLKWKPKFGSSVDATKLEFGLRTGGERHDESPRLALMSSDSALSDGPRLGPTSLRR